MTQERSLARSFLACLFLLAACSHAAAAIKWRRIDSSSEGVLPAPAAEVEPTAALTVDIDRDGDQDLIVGGRDSGPGIVLWRHEGGRWSTEIIEPDHMRIEAGGAVHDIDDDGDPDIVFGGDYRAGEIWWWENPLPAKGRWQRRLIKQDEHTRQHDQIFGDFDGDGKPELVSWNQRAQALLRFTIPDQPKRDALWPISTLFEWEQGRPAHEGLAAADVDGDGVLDIVGTGYWFPHTSDGVFAAEQVDPAMPFTRAAAGQFVRGGRPELVFAPGDRDGPLNWYEWTNGRWVAHRLMDHVVHGHSLEVADIDDDGHLDILVGEMGSWTNRLNNPTARVLVFFGNGRGEFKRQTVSIGQGVHEARLGDLDGDGDLDIFGKPFRHNAPRLVVWLNEGNLRSPLPLDRWERHLIDDVAPGKRIFVETPDIDGDGRLDIITGDAWFRNPGRIGSDWSKHHVGEGFGNLAISHDFDRDGDIDLLGTTAEFQGSEFALAINRGDGRFTVRTDLPAGNGDFLQGVAVGRLKNSVDLVALSWHKDESGIEALIVPEDAPPRRMEARAALADDAPRAAQRR